MPPPPPFPIVFHAASFWNLQEAEMLKHLCHFFESKRFIEKTLLSSPQILFLNFYPWGEALFSYLISNNWSMQQTSNTKSLLLFIDNIFTSKSFSGVFFFVHCIIENKNIKRNWQKKKNNAIYIWILFMKYEIVWKYNTSLNITEVIHVQYHESISNTPFYHRSAHNWSIAPDIFGSVCDLGGSLK